MNARKKRFVKRGIVIPLIMSLIIAILFFAVYAFLTENMLFERREFHLSDYSSAEVMEAEQLSTRGEVISKRDLPVIKDNTIIGSADLNGQAMPIISNPSEANTSARLSLSQGVLIGERGCAVLFCNKKDNAVLKAIKVNDIVKIDTFYGSYEYKIVATVQAQNDIGLTRAADELSRAVVIYTDISDGVGISNSRYALIGKMTSGISVCE